MSAKFSDLKRFFRRIFGLKFLLLWVAFGCFILTRFLKSHPHVVEKYYTHGAYLLIIRLLSKVSDWVSFSLNNLLVVVLFFVLLVMLFSLLAGHLNGRNFLLVFLNLGAAIYIAFYCLWGFNYYREDLYSRLVMKADSISSTDYEFLVRKLSEKAAAMEVRLESVSRERMDSLVDAAFRMHGQRFGLPWLKRDIKPKVMLAENWLARQSVYGYYGVFFGEVHVSRTCNPADYPLLLAHERVHRLGITGEGEANFYAWLLCFKSDSPELRYAAHVFLLRHLMDAGFGEEFHADEDQGQLRHENDTRTPGRFFRLLVVFQKWNRVENNIGDYGRMIEPAANYLFQVEKWKKTVEKDRSLKKRRHGKA